MSWFSRAGGSWGGRFSPFGRTSGANGGEVTDGDFSYITSEDLANAASSQNQNQYRQEIVDWADDNDRNPGRDADILVFKHGRTNFPAHFPKGSIRDGEVRIGAVRAAAARKIGIRDPERVRMFFKGRNLKHDERSAREEGLRGDGSGSEILCVVGVEQDRSAEDDEDEDTEGGTDSGVGSGAGKKKGRKRGGKKKKKGGASSNAGYTNATSTASEFLPTPTSHLPSRPSPSQTPTPTPSTPLTPLAKLDALASKFHTEFVPLCVSYIQNPPAEKSKREFEYKKLSETILAQILLKLDGVETEGDPEARVRRKEIVREVQNMLNRLDGVVKN